MNAATDQTVARGSTRALPYQLDAAEARRQFERTPIVVETYEARFVLRDRFERLERAASHAWQEELAGGGNDSPCPAIAALLRRRVKLDNEQLTERRLPVLELAQRKLELDQEIAALRASAFAEADAVRRIGSATRADERRDLLGRQPDLAVRVLAGDADARIEFESIEARLAELAREDDIEALAATAARAREAA